MSALSVSWPGLCVWVYVAIFTEGSPQNLIRVFDIKLARVIQFGRPCPPLHSACCQSRLSFDFSSLHHSFTVLIPRGANCKLCHPLISTLARIAQLKWLKAKWNWCCKCPCSDIYPFFFFLWTLELFLVELYFINRTSYGISCFIVVWWFSVNKPQLPTSPPSALVSDRCNW